MRTPSHYRLETPVDTSTHSNGTARRNASTAPPALIESTDVALVDGYDGREVVRRTPVNDVFLAYHRPTGTLRELIVVDRIPGVDQDALRQTIETEVAAARAVSHAGVARVEDVGLTNDGRLFVATTRPVGQPLHTLLAEAGRLPVLRAFELAHMLVTAVATAHERGIVHGWLAPSSVVVVPPTAGWPERLVVLGVGTAAAQDAGIGARALSAEHFPYASPQRGVGEPPTPQDDVFSLGSLLLWLFVGSPPSVVRAVTAERSPTEAADEARNPGDIEQLLTRARAADRERRYASARELGTALWAVHNAWFASRADDPGSDAERASVAGARARRLALVAAGIVGVVATAGAAVRIWRDRDRGAPAVSPVATTPPVAPHAAPQVAPEVGTQVAPPVATQVALATSVPGLPTPSAPADDVVSAPPRPGAERSGSRSAFGAGSARPALPPVALQPAQAASRRPRITAGAPAATLAAATAPNPNTPGPTISTANTSTPNVTTSSAGEVTSPGTSDASVATPDAGGPDATRGAVAGEVLATVAEYGTAVGARDLGRLEHIYPAMTEQQRRGWQAFFGSVSDLHAPFTVEQITVSGATAQVRMRTAYEYENLRPHRAERSVVSYKLTLAHAGSGWKIRAVE